MNKVLIDSHILLWLLQEPHKIGIRATASLIEADVVYVSQATILELTLKYKKGKLSFSPQEIITGISDLGAIQLALNNKHITGLVDLKSENKDPFDMLLMSQAKSEDIFFLTADTLILKSRPHYVMDARV